MFCSWFPDILGLVLESGLLSNKSETQEVPTMKNWQKVLILSGVAMGLSLPQQEVRLAIEAMR